MMFNRQTQARAVGPPRPGSGCRAGGSPGALVLRPSGELLTRPNVAKDPFAPAARKRGPHYPDGFAPLYGT